MLRFKGMILAFHLDNPAAEMNMKAIRFVVLTMTVISCGLFSIPSTADGIYLELTHASTAGASDRNLGRNFLHAGWSFENDFNLSAGVYFIGRQRCTETLSIGKRFGNGRWETSLIGHDTDECHIDGRDIEFQRNIGLCLARELQLSARLVGGVGGCLWEHGDYAVGNVSDPADPSSVVDDPQVTFWLIGRFSFSSSP